MVSYHIPFCVILFIQVNPSGSHVTPHPGSLPCLRRAPAGSCLLLPQFSRELPQALYVQFAAEAAKIVEGSDQDQNMM